MTFDMSDIRITLTLTLNYVGSTIHERLAEVLKSRFVAAKLFRTVHFLNDPRDIVNCCGWILF